MEACLEDDLDQHGTTKVSVEHCKSRPGVWSLRVTKHDRQISYEVALKVGIAMIDAPDKTAFLLSVRVCSICSHQLTS